MNKSAFLRLIQQASNITDQQQNELEQVAAAFPYCQTAHLLLAKSAYDKGSMLSTQRLRRASSYATDRQLLKRIIYTAPVLETAAVADEPIEEQDNVPVLTKDHPSERKAEDSPEEDVPVAIVETIADKANDQGDALEEVYTHMASVPDPYTAASAEAMEEENPEAEIDSELALLFTFNSISSSSTDLLSERELEETNTAQFEQEIEINHFAETTEALGAIEESETGVHDNPVIEDEAVPVEDIIFEQKTGAAHATPEEAAMLPLASESELFEAEEEQTLPKSEDAAINYTFDEIDRLYAEDALGYAMGSSRMGEALQLKDDYTRPRPQSFHPELILEYSKTHELEKAIQPTANVLSHQLNIIDQFLKLNPRLKTMSNLKLKPEPQEDLSLKSSKIKKGMASESLASIFLKQGKTKKALKIYEQLILKYPEKKSYFAEQIEKLQNIT